MTRPFAVRFESARPVRGVVPRGVAVGEAEAFTTRDDLIARLDALDVAWGALAWSVNSFFKSRFAGDVYPKDVDQFSPEQAKRLQQDVKWFLDFSKAYQDYQEFSKGHSTAAWWTEKSAASGGDGWTAGAIGIFRVSYDDWQTRAGADYGIVPRKMLPSAPEEGSSFFYWAGGAALLGTAGFAAYKIHERYFAKGTAVYNKTSPAVSQDEDIAIETDEA